MLNNAIQYNLYSQIMALISQGKPEEAIASLQTQPRETQLSLIVQIAQTLDRDLGLDRVVDFNEVFGLTQTFNIDLDRAIVLTRVIEFGHALTQALTLELDMNLDFELIRHIDYTITAVFVIRRVLYELLDEATLRLVNIDVLTANALQEKILPYIQALGTLQKVVAEIRGEDFKEPVIQRIEAEGASIDLTGVRDTVEILHKIIVPWQRKHVPQHGRNEFYAISSSNNAILTEEDRKHAEIDLIHTVIDQIRNNQQLSEQQRTYYFAVLMKPVSILTQQMVDVRMKAYH